MRIIKNNEKIFFGICLIVGMLSLTACFDSSNIGFTKSSTSSTLSQSVDSDSSSDTTDSSSTSDTTESVNFKLYIAGGELPHHMLNSTVTAQKIEIRNQSEEYTTLLENYEINFSNLANGALNIATQATLATASYDRIKITISAINGTRPNGEAESIDLSANPMIIEVNIDPVISISETSISLMLNLAPSHKRMPPPPERPNQAEEPKDHPLPPPLLIDVVQLANTGAIQGVISANSSDGSSVSVLKNAHIAIAQDKKILRAVVSDENGAYEINGLPAGTYDLLVRARGYERSIVEQITINAEDSITENLTLNVKTDSEQNDEMEDRPPMPPEDHP